MKSKGKVFLEDYVNGHFRCTCAYYYSSTNRADPDCFLCTNRKTILKMLNKVRWQTTKEVMSLTKTELAKGGEITITSLPLITNYESDYIWLN